MTKLAPSLFTALIILAFGAMRPALAANAVLDPTLTPPAPRHERVLVLPGDLRRQVQRQVTIFTPDGAAPFPLAVHNHGWGLSQPDPQSRDSPL